MQNICFFDAWMSCIQGLQFCCDIHICAEHSEVPTSSTLINSTQLITVHLYPDYENVLAVVDVQ